jgi:hypothetical protein
MKNFISARRNEPMVINGRPPEKRLRIFRGEYKPEDMRNNRNTSGVTECLEKS